MTRFRRTALASLLLLAGIQLTAAPAREFRAGTVAVDITPAHFPVIVNGGFLEKTTTNVNDRLHARALALDDGSTRLVICVVDTCMMPRDLIDRAKELARQQTGLPVNRMLVSATHTHSAPSAMACLGSRADTNYVAFLPGKIAEAITGALKELQPARIGWASVDDWDHTFNRRWIRRPDKLIVDPYGQPTGRAHMHPGHQSPDAIGPSGPVDPELSILAVQTRAGHPLALLGNYSQHYFGASALSADYYGRFADHIAKALGVAHGQGPFVGIMSQGTSGDLMWMDYAAPRRQINHDTYAREVADRAMAAYRQIEWRDWAPLKMAEATLPLAYRVPDASRLAWARKVAASYSDRLPKDWPEVYANEALILHERQRTELVLQALRIGDLAIATLPNEVFAITGLKLKAQSPLKTFNIELANGSEGYIPPPEQHALGGYTTWAARTAGLETNAEPKIVETLLKLLEQVSDKPRRKPATAHSPYAEAILAAKPAAYWRFEEMVFPTAKDATRNRKDATYEYGIALYLPGVGSGTGVSPKAALTPSAFSGPDQINRAAHFAGGRLKADLRVTGKAYSVEFWLWNGLPVNLFGTTGALFGTAHGDQLLITGTNKQSGRLQYYNSGRSVQQFGAPWPSSRILTNYNSGRNWMHYDFVGNTELGLKNWHHVVFVRSNSNIAVYLDGQTKPEISGEAPYWERSAKGIYFGGSSDGRFHFDGRLDEVAVYDRALKPEEIAAHWKLSGLAAQRAAEAAEREQAAQALAARANPPAFPPTHKEAILALKPAVYWPLTDAKGNSVTDVSDNPFHGTMEPGVSISPTAFATFTGGRIHLKPIRLGDIYSVSFWFRNDLPNDSRPVTAYLFSHGWNGNRQAPGDHLGIGGTHRGDLTGRLMFFNGNERNQVIAGRTVIPPGTWNHVVLVRQAGRVTAWLNGTAEPEFSGEADNTTGGAREFYLGARSDHFAPLQGYIGAFALFDRALNVDEAKRLHQASGQPVGTSSVSSTAPVQPKATTAIPLVSPPLSPAESLKKIHVREGFRVELAAAEPLTMDPTAIDWDERGRLWVVEMADYPLGMDGKGKAGGRVRVLEDVDGDGRYDKSTLFADGLNFPTGLLTWRDGVIVTAAPDILFLRDTNGDGRADERRVLFTGFFEGNQQLRVNGLRWGLDNWVYCANGGHHAGYGDKTKIVSKLTGKEIELGSRDFRFRPDTGEIEPESGPTQFGRNRDDWGNWFGTQNSWPLWHYVLPDRYLRRNPHLAAPSPVRQVVTPANPSVYPASAIEKRFHSFNESGRFTSACAGMIYRDELLFDRAYAHAFTCEPFHNLVQHNLLSDDGTSFNFRRAPEEAKLDFFASTDRWCRPVMTRTGPDGALWVVDMYRYMIEHPQWLPANGRDELLPHYREGDDKGRIYRVVPVDGKRERLKAKVNLAAKDTAPLVAALDSPSGWIRDKAQQLLLWKADKAALPLLEKVAFENASPYARLHALCTLDGLQALKPELVERALRDKHPGVRINALRLAETRGTPGVIAAAGELASDSDPKVRLQLAFSLGEWQDAAAGQTLAKLAIADDGDPFLRAAVLSSALPHCAALVGAVVKAGDPAFNNLSEPLMTLALGLNERGSLARLLEPMLAASNGRFSGAQLESFGRFLDLLARRKSSLAELQKASAGDVLSTRLNHAQSLLTFASSIASDAKAPLADRAAAAGLLAREPSQRAQALQLLGGWLTPQTAADTQRVAVRSLALTGDDQVPARLLDHWPAASPETRATMLETLLSREPWTLALLEGVKADRVSPLAFDAARRAQLQRHQSQRVRGLANQLFKPGASSRAQVVEQFRPALALKGDAPRGQAIHTKLCLSCHKLGNTGNEVGPDLRSVVEHPPEKLLINILDPSSDVQPGFFAYNVTLKNGEELYGLIASEAGNSVTLKLADGSTRAIVRNDIETLRGSNLSLMPEGLESGLSQQDLADLIAFLKAPQ